MSKGYILCASISKKWQAIGRRLGFLLIAIFNESCTGNMCLITKLYDESTGTSDFSHKHICMRLLSPSPCMVVLRLLSEQSHTNMFVGKVLSTSLVP
jgi:hypothetical protein